VSQQVTCPVQAAFSRLAEYYSQPEVRQAFPHGYLPFFGPDTDHVEILVVSTNPRVNEGYLSDVEKGNVPAAPMSPPESLTYAHSVNKFAKNLINSCQATSVHMFRTSSDKEWKDANRLLEGRPKQLAYELLETYIEVKKPDRILAIGVAARTRLAITGTFEKQIANQNVIKGVYRGLDVFCIPDISNPNTLRDYYPIDREAAFRDIHLQIFGVQS
jgi:hypothetical protein